MKSHLNVDCNVCVFLFVFLSLFFTGSISELVAHYVASQGLGAKSLYKLPPEGEDQIQDQDGSALSEEEEQMVQSMTKLERLHCKSLQVVQSMTELERLHLSHFSVPFLSSTH